MNVKIWRVLAQILYYHNDSIEIIKPFFENLKNENINDEKYIPFLKTFSKDQLEALQQNRIITEEKFNSIVFNTKNQNQTQSSSQSSNLLIEEIISGDEIIKLQELIQKQDIKTFNTINKSFFEVKIMKIPIIQYCIMKNAIECFKYLLVNGFDDPNKTMEEQNPYPEVNINHRNWKTQHRYEWDCMATAIYVGNREIVKILEGKGIEKGKKPSHIEAAILSYRNVIAKEIIENLNENKEQIQNILNKCVIAAAKNNNIKGIEFLLIKGLEINTHDIELNST